MAAPKELVRLVENFDRNLAAYTSPAYNEAQVRVEFLDPMFELLGWDVSNKAANAEAYKDVVHEGALRFGGTTKAPDYSFRVGGTRKFFLEAKKPSISIKDEPTAAYQLRRYAWSAKLPLSILSDFAELAVYDCRVKPEKTDKPVVARINYLTYDAYPSKWDEIPGVFSKDAVLKGSFDRFAEEKKGKKGTAAVDAEFLKEIERWRELLARNIALRNPRLSIRELNEAVQRTIDRIVFLRICEDRGIETDRQFQLQFLLNGVNTYRRLFELFQRGDERYNSGLFHFQKEKDFTEAPDTLTPSLRIDDKVLKDIVSNLYYPDSPYEFSVLPADILGQVYEQFLGKVIRLTAGHQAKVEDKPEVKKAGGVYYTPTYIVDYIVEHTVGELLKEKTPKEAADLKVLDPACGSGSFLLGAYQRLLDWHRDWYVNDGPDKHTKPRKGGQPALFQGGHAEWRLTTAERKRILLNSIFGVDVDPQAVEVTKLSLLLKVLEGESDQTLQTQLRLFHERALPDLGSNIKCGNSLIGSDFFHGRQGELFDDEEALRVNPFDWDKGYPEIFTRPNPGFDAVIANPPYVRIHTLVEFYPEQAKFIQSKYESARFGKVDIYVPFLERALDLVHKHGLVGVIVPNKFMQADYGVGLRRLITHRKALRELIDFGSAQVFRGATTYTCLVFLCGRPTKMFDCAFGSEGQLPEQILSSATRERRPTPQLSEKPWALAIKHHSAILEKAQERGVPLTSFLSLAITGIKTGANNVFLFEELGRSGGLITVRSEGGSETFQLEGAALRPIWRAESMKRYWQPRGAGLLVLYPYEQHDDATALLPMREMKARLPRAWAYLVGRRSSLEARQRGQMRGPNWYGLSFASSLAMFTSTKLISPTLAPRNSFSLDKTGHLFPQGAGGGCGFVARQGVVPQYLLGLLNSRLLTFCFQQISSRFQGGWFAYEPRYLRRIPICEIKRSDPAKRTCHDRIVELVDRMLALHTKLAAARTDHEKTVLQRQIDATDREIDALVYELYALTDEEIKIVEGSPQ